MSRVVRIWPVIDTVVTELSAAAVYPVAVA